MPLGSSEPLMKAPASGLLGGREGIGGEQKEGCGFDLAVRRRAESSQKMGVGVGESGEGCC